MHCHGLAQVRQLWDKFFSLINLPLVLREKGLRAEIKRKKRFVRRLKFRKLKEV